MGARVSQAVPSQQSRRPSVLERKDAEECAALRAMLVEGGGFLLDGSSAVEPVWGDGERCLWAEGEGLMVCGGQGVGKTTIAGQLALARMGLRNEVLGMPVNPGKGTLLYLACDRPKQARRSMARMVTADDRVMLDERLRVWRGPLPKNLVEDPQLLLRLCRAAGADTLVIDSLKDIAVKLSDDATGSAVNSAFQFCIAAEIEVVVLHHQRKAGSGVSGQEPSSIADVYGSTWLTSGMGSVVYLGGQPGDIVVKLKHLKQPAEVVGPLEVIHDHVLGKSRVEDQVDPLDLLRQSRHGLTAQVLAAALGDPSGSRPSVERARRILDGYVRKGWAEVRDGEAVGGGKAPRIYSAVGGATARAKKGPLPKVAAPF